MATAIRGEILDLHSPATGNKAAGRGNACADDSVVESMAEAVYTMVREVRRMVMTYALINVPGCAVSEKRDMRGTINALCGAIRAKSKTVRDAARAALDEGLTRALKRNSAWQTRVCEDLGGDVALARWERRIRKVSDKADSSFEAPLRSAPQDEANRDLVRKDEIIEPPHPEAPAKRASKDARTDRDGIFRLAPIPRGSIGSRKAATANHERQISEWREPRDSFFPIALTPFDLRPVDVAEMSGLNIGPPLIDADLDVEVKRLFRGYDEAAYLLAYVNIMIP